MRTRRSGEGRSLVSRPAGGIPSLAAITTLTALFATAAALPAPARAAPQLFGSDLTHAADQAPFGVCSMVLGSPTPCTLSAEAFAPANTLGTAEPIDGIITSFSIRTMFPTSVTFRLVKDNGAGTAGTGAGTGPTVTLAGTNAVETFPAHLPGLAGDFVGINASDGATALNCSVSFMGGELMWAPLVDGAAPTSEFANGGCEMEIQATVVPYVHALTVVPSSFGFGARNVNAGATPAQSFTVTNTGNANLNFASVALTGPDFSQFKFVGDGCVAPVVPGGTCVVSIDFAPTTVGGKSADLHLTDNASGSPQNIVITGTGVVPPVAPPQQLKLRLQVKPRSFSVRRYKKVQLVYDLNATAPIKLSLSRELRGYEVSVHGKARCSRKKPQGVKRPKRCTILARTKTFSLSGKPGHSTVALRSLAKASYFAPGAYLLKGTALAPNGSYLQSATQRVTLQARS
jgi:hypothetical protein